MIDHDLAAEFRTSSLTHTTSNLETIYKQHSYAVTQHGALLDGWVGGDFGLDGFGHLNNPGWADEFEGLELQIPTLT